MRLFDSMQLTRYLCVLFRSQLFSRRFHGLFFEEEMIKRMIYIHLPKRFEFIALP